MCSGLVPGAPCRKAGGPHSSVSAGLFFRAEPQTRICQCPSTRASGKESRCRTLVRPKCDMELSPRPCLTLQPSSCWSQPEPGHMQKQLPRALQAAAGCGWEAPARLGRGLLSSLGAGVPVGRSPCCYGHCVRPPVNACVSGADLMWHGADGRTSLAPRGLCRTEQSI